MALLTRLNVIAMAFLIAGGCLRHLTENGSEHKSEYLDPFKIECRPNVKPVQVLKAPDSHLTHIAFSPDGKLLAAGGLGRDVLVWDYPSGKQRFSLRRIEVEGVFSYLTGLFFSSDGKTLHTATFWEAGLKRWDVINGRLASTLNVKNVTWCCAAVAAKKNLMITTGTSEHPIISNNFEPKKNGIWFWEGSPPRLAATMAGDEKCFCSVSISPDGKLFVTGDEDGILTVWDANKKTRIASFPICDGSFSVSFSPDGKRISTVARHQNVMIWQMSQLLDLAEAGNTDLPVYQVSIQPIRDSVWSMRWSPDGGYIAISSVMFGDRRGTSENVSICSTSDGREIANLGSGETGIGGTGVAFHPSGSVLATAHNDGTIRIWSFADLLKGKERQ